MQVIITQKSELEVTETKQPKSWNRMSELGFKNNRKGNLWFWIGYEITNDVS